MLRVPVFRFRRLRKHVFGVWGAFVRAPDFKYRKSFLNGMLFFKMIISWSNFDIIGRADSPCWSFAYNLHKNAAIGRNSWSNNGNHNSANKCAAAQMVLWDSKWYSGDRIAIAHACVDHSQWFLAATATEESKTAAEKPSWRCFSVTESTCFLTRKHVSGHDVIFFSEITCRKK